MKKNSDERQRAVEAFLKHGTIAGAARELGLARATVREHVRKAGLDKKPLVDGALEARQAKSVSRPRGREIKRFICTSAQNNTHVNASFLRSLEALAKHRDARILVGTFTYNQNRFGNLAVKRGTKQPYQTQLWYDPAIEKYICDERLELAKGLVWCGEMNILPTAVDPLVGLETMAHGNSAIFPHAKLAMRSIATMDEGCRFNYTTGAVTQHNYIQKKEGQRAEHHHKYAALMVEVESSGAWWVRQIGVGAKGSDLQDLDVLVVGDNVVEDHSVEAITWGDLHATMVDDHVVEGSLDMLDALKPKHQFLHDVLEGTSINRHVVAKGPDPHYAFYRWCRGLHRFDEEMKRTVEVLRRYLRPWCKTIVPESNHDGGWLRAWLAKYDYRVDPGNAELFLELQRWSYQQIRELTAEGKLPKDMPLVAKAFELFGLTGAKFLLPDQSYTVCGDKIECGMHGHLGPNGAQGTPNNLNNMGKRANTAHTHSAGIWNGLYVAGTSSKLKWSYNWGPSAWSHSHVVTYPGGQRCIVTMNAGRWRA